MTWLAEGLQQRKDRHQENIEKNDHSRWLDEAGATVLSESQKDEGIVRELAVSSKLSDGFLEISVNDVSIGQYGANGGEFFFAPSRWNENASEQLLMSEEEFHEHLCNIVWTCRDIKPVEEAAEEAVECEAAMEAAAE